LAAPDPPSRQDRLTCLRAKTAYLTAKNHHHRVNWFLMRLELHFLGSPKIVVAGKTSEVRRQHALALLAYLALEPGWHSREQVSAMLWGDADTTQAQQNLRTALAHLRDVLGEASEVLNATRSKLQLLPEAFWLDVRQLQNPDSLDQAAALYRGDFLSGVQLPSAPDFDHWLETLRERLRLQFDALLAGLLSEQRQNGQTSAALETARRRVGLDAFNEPAHRVLIELLLEQGNRAAALEVFKALERQLERELGLSPSPETLQLAQRIQSQSVVAAVPEPFVARIEEWQWLETAKRDHVPVLLRGEPGVGKSRLLREFARAYGESLWLYGRPGDQSVPFAAVTRFLREQQVADLNLPQWVRFELHALLPELPGAGSSQKERLLAALLACFGILAKKNTLFVWDDWQFLDPSSLELLFYLLEQSQLFVFGTARSGELSAETERHIATLVSAQRLQQIELPRLTIFDLEQMLRAMNLDTHQAELLFKRSGGNPLYALESLRAGLGTASKQLGQLIEARLERLSKPARDVARVAAILEREFNLELAAQMLEVRELELLEPLEELQNNGLVQDLRLVHDLVQDSLRHSMPLATKRWLHGRALLALEAKGSNAALLAFHALEAAKPLLVLRHAARAGGQALEMYAYTEAIQHHEHALLALEAVSDAEAVTLGEKTLLGFFDSFATLLTQQSRFVQLHRVLSEGIDWARHKRFVWLEAGLCNLDARALLREGTQLELAEERYLTAASLTEQHPVLRLDTLLTRHHLEGARGDWLAAKSCARAAAEEAADSGQRELQQEALMGVLFSAQNLGAWEEVRAVALEVRPISERLGGRASLAHGWAVSAIASTFLGQPRRALEEAEKATALLSNIGWGSGQRFAAQAQTQAHIELGDLHVALEQNAPTVFHEHASSRPAAFARSWWTRANIYFLRGEYELALEALAKSQQVIKDVMPFDAFQIEAAIESLRSAVLLEMGDQKAAIHAALTAKRWRETRQPQGWTNWTPHGFEVRVLCLHDPQLAFERLLQLEQLEFGNPRFLIEVLAAKAEFEFAQHNTANGLVLLEQALGVVSRLELPLCFVQLERRRLQHIPNADMSAYQTALRSIAARLPDELGGRFLESKE
jgi:DNA-binding SARP family transcriptional activator